MPGFSGLSVLSVRRQGVFEQRSGVILGGAVVENLTQNSVLLATVSIVIHVVKLEEDHFLGVLMYPIGNLPHTAAVWVRATLVVVGEEHARWEHQTVVNVQLEKPDSYLELVVHSPNLTGASHWVLVESVLSRNCGVV